MEKPMRYVGDQIVTPSQLSSNARCDAFQTVTLQTDVTESKLLRPDGGGCGDGATLSDGWLEFPVGG
jgi:hypothetical protein